MTGRRALGDKRPLAAIDTMAPKGSVFIVRATDAAEWVGGYLRPALERSGMHVHDATDLVHGELELTGTINDLPAAHHVLVVLSRGSMADDSQHLQELVGMQASLARRDWSLIPILLHPVEPSPLLRLLHPLDMTDPTAWDQRMAGLVRLLGRTRSAPPKAECPYPGLAAYGQEQAESFFGRDRETAQLVEIVERRRRVVIIGSSGSGKSSLARAGVAAQLDGSGWTVAVCRPGRQPRAALQNAVVRVARVQGSDRLVIVDQLEELFETGRMEVERFGRHIVSLLGTGQVALLFTVRADFMDRLMAWEAWQSLMDHQVQLLPLRGAELEAAIREPARRAGVVVDSMLVARLRDEANGQPGALPLLQETMRQLWTQVRERHITVSAYEALVHEPGTSRTGLEAALQRYADQAMRGIKPSQVHEAALRVLLRLVDYVEGRSPVRRQRRLSELIAADDDPEAARAAIAALVDSRLVTSGAGNDPTDPVLDLAHEALTTAWTDFAALLEQRRAAEQYRRHLADKEAEWRRLDGAGGLLDAGQLAQAEEWLAGPQPGYIGVGQPIRGYIARSRQTVDARLSADRRSRRRLRASVVGLSILLVAAVLSASFSVLQTARVSDQELRASTRELALAAGTTHQEQLDRAMLLGVAAYGMSPGADSEGGLFNALASNGRVLQMDYAAEPLVALAASADGSVFAAGSRDGVIRLARSTGDVQSDRDSVLLLQLPPSVERPLSSLFLSPDGLWVGAGARDGSITTWDLRDHDVGEASDSGHRPRAEELDARAGGAVSALAVSPDGQWRAAGWQDGVIKVYATSGSTSYELRDHIEAVDTLAFSPDSTLLVSGGGSTSRASRDTDIRVWDVGTTKPPRRLQGHSDAVRAVAVRGDGAVLASASTDTTVRLWNLADGSAGAVLTGHTERVYSLAFFGDGGHLLASAGRDHAIRLWDTRNATPVAGPLPDRLLGHDQSVRGIVRLNDNRLASGGGDRRLVTWDLSPSPGPRLATRLDGPAVQYLSVVASPDGSRVATSTGTGALVVRDAVSGTVLSSPTHSGPPVTAMAFSPDGERIVGATTDRRLHVWDVDANGTSLRDVDAEEYVRAVAVSPSGLVATGGDGQSIFLWDEELEPVGGPFQEHLLDVTSLAFVGEDHLASVGADGRALLWTLDEGSASHQTLSTEGGQFFAVGVSGARSIVAGDTEGRVHAWHTSDPVGRQAPETQQLASHTGRVVVVAASSSGDRVVTVDDGGTLDLWARERDRLSLLGSMTVGVRVDAAAFASGNRWLFLGTERGLLRLEMDPARWVERACLVAGRDVGPAERTEFRQLPERDVCPALPTTASAVPS